MTWKQIYGFENYEISSSGEIRSIERKDRLGRRWGSKPIKSFVLKNGYVYTQLSRHGRGHTVKIHRLLANTFFGPRKYPEYEVGHLNGIRNDNRLENLKWCTRPENQRHRTIHGTANSGIRNGRCKLGAHQIVEIRRLLSEKKFAYREISSKFGVTPQYIGQINRGERWKHHV